ncbi:MAG: extracellular solute-binding protein [Gammaproteobacteria bacterium]|nr:extracellular solute-binding protein [Gammaproteobacteria bacterium]
MKMNAKTFGIMGIIALGTMSLAPSLASAGWKELITQQYQELTAPTQASGKVVLCFASEKKSMKDYLPVELKKQYKDLEVVMRFGGSGELVQEIKDGNPNKCDLISPASRLSSIGAPGYTPTAKSIGATPIVIAMQLDAYNELTKVLGHPVGFADLGEISGKVWKQFAPSAGKRGIIKIGFTQPKFSNSGLVGVLTYLHEATGKYEPMTAEDIDENAAKIKDLWTNVNHTETSTGTLGDKFASAAGTLTAIVTYESELPKIFSGMASKGGVKVIYPDPGIMNDHPIWVVEGSQNKMATDAVMAYLLSKDGQNQMARYTHLRPINPKATLEFPPEMADSIIWDVGPVDVPTDPKVLNNLREYTAN